MSFMSYLTNKYVLIGIAVVVLISSIAVGVLMMSSKPKTEKKKPVEDDDEPLPSPPPSKAAAPVSAPAPAPAPPAPSSYCNGLNPDGVYNNTYWNNDPNKKAGVGKIMYNPSTGQGRLNNGSSELTFKCVGGNTFEIVEQGIKGNFKDNNTMQWSNNSTWIK